MLGNYNNRFYVMPRNPACGWSGLAYIGAPYQAWSNGTITERELRLEFSQLKPDRPVFFGTFLVHEHRSPVAEILRRGDGCVKDTRNPPRHRSRHPRDNAKLLGA